MNITFAELRRIKHQLPTGSVKKIADGLSLDEQTVRNFFGANKFKEGDFVGKHIQPGPNGGIVNITDDSILNAAKKIIHEAQFATQ
ncbi:MAG: DNA-binding protein [Saprospiraceae bacterium]|nr:DNA-binding protein [Saprospiraceae bacterium]